MKILVDMNLPPDFASFLMKKDFEAIHWQDVGSISAKDTEIMLYAIENNYIIITQDSDFATILFKTHNKKASVVQVRMKKFNMIHDYELIICALLKNKIELEQGAILSVNVKLRLLPL